MTPEKKTIAQTGRPLSGRKILITRAADGERTLIDRLRRSGADVLECPMTRIEEVDTDKNFLKQHDLLDLFTDIIFSSRNAVKIFYRKYLEAGLAPDKLSRLKVTGIGPGTADALNKCNVRADITSSLYQQEGLLNELEDNLCGRKFLFPCARGARKVLASGISDRGGEVYEWELYVSVPVDIKRDLDLGDIDAVFFTSPSAAKNFSNIFPGNLEAKIFAIGNITAEALIKCGFKDIIVAKEATMEGLIDAAVETLADSVENIKIFNTQNPNPKQIPNLNDRNYKNRLKK